MANRWIDGLGRYGGTVSYMLNGSAGQAWAQIDSAAFTLSTSNPRTGTHCLRENDGTISSTQTARRAFGSQLTEVYFGYAIHCAALPSEDPGSGGDVGHFIARFSDQSNNTQITLYLGTDGRLALYRPDGGGTLVDESDPIIGAGAYQHIEIYAKAGNGTDGAFEVRVDEVTKLNLTGIDTVSSANVEFSQVSIGHDNTAALASIDRADFFCNDTVDDGSGCDTWVGDVKSGVLMVNGDTAQADFALSTGVSGYALLDEKPPNDADYIDTPDTTAESDFELEDGPANLTEILTARPFVRAFKDDAGTCSIAPSMISNAVKATVDAKPVTTAPAYYDSNVPVDPDTGVPWIAAGLNAALHVVERTA